MLKNQRGQGLVEYVIIVALVAVASMGLVRILQATVKVNLANIVYALQGDGRTRRAPKAQISDADLNKSDMSDFMNGASSRDRK